MSNGSDAGRGLIGFGLGIIAGAVGALLLAPASGRETRRRIGSMAHRIGEETQHKLDDARHYVDEAKHFVTDRKNRLGKAIEEGRETYRREAGNMAPGHEPE